jgi:NAD(P)-dependent dehydrogenase (short-subunit alcohol dehydrogenase family)
MAVPHLKNKQVLITGAGSGIGRAAALAFARRGANIVASDINPEVLDAVKHEIEALGVSCLTHVADVSDESAMKEFADLVHAKVGAVDVLVNNAGVAYLGRFLDGDLDHWARVLNVNLMGVVHGCRYFIPPMISAGGARQVLNVASGAGNYPTPSLAAYCASKYAVTGFSEVLKMELANSAVGVTTVCPGVTTPPSFPVPAFRLRCQPLRSRSWKPITEPRVAHPRSWPKTWCAPRRKAPTCASPAPARHRSITSNACHRN